MKISASHLVQRVARIALAALFTLAVIALASHHSFAATDASHPDTECSFCVAHSSCAAGARPSAIELVTVHLWVTPLQVGFNLDLLRDFELPFSFKSRAPPAT